MREDPVQILRGSADLALLAAGWERLAAEAGGVPMDDFPWAQASADTFAQEGLHVVVAGEMDAPRGVAPMVERGGRLELLGTAVMYEPADLLAATDEGREELVDGLAGLRRPLLLGCIPADSPTIDLLRERMRARLVVREVEAGPLIRLGDAWTEVGGGLNSRRRADLRRAQRRAEEAGEVTVDFLSPEPADVPALLDEAFAVEDRSWKAGAGTSLIRDELRGRFFRRYSDEAARRGQLRLDFLRIGGETAAMQLGIEWRNRMWLLKIGFDDTFARASPGMILLAHAVTDAARRGLTCYELLGGAEAWARAWTDEFRPMAAVAVYPLHARGAVAFARDAGRYARSEHGRARTRGVAKKTGRVARERLADRYMAGRQLADALTLDAAYRGRGRLTTIGFFDGPEDDGRTVLAEYRAQADAFGGRDDAQLSIKVPSIDYDRAAVADLLERATVGVHFDALAPETQTAVLDLATELAPASGGRLGCTLAGRWARSVEDARRVAEAGLRVRVVKSEWPSEDDPDRDPRRGYVEVVEALAGAGAPFVAVATQDAAVARRCLEILSGAGIAAELQVLHGKRARGALEAARSLGVPVRVYVPYGYPWLPFSIRNALRDPRTGRRLVRDLIQRKRPL
jgi:CelD/BcsL family acetyltransferase involved in cellulose biosynthesis